MSNIISDAKRCLQCKNPACTRACPAGTPIKDAIKLMLDGNLRGAGELLFDNNPLSIVCSLICPHETQCEGHCVLGKKTAPIHVGAIEHYISDYYLDIFQPQVSRKDQGKVAIIGSGPAGITIAFLLARKNYDVTIFEGYDQIGGVLRYGIPEFRLPKILLTKLMNTLLALGIKIRPNTTIGTSITIEELFRDDFKAIFIGTGVWRPLKLGIKGESLGHVHYAIEYLRSPAMYRLGNRLLIIGAGNVAMDVARTALRNGSREVYIMCNRGEDTISARGVELEHAKIDGAKFEYYKTAVQFVDEGAIFADSEVVEDADGRKITRAIPGTEKLYPADSVIIAISQGPRSVIVSSTTGIDVHDNGLLLTDESGRTSREGIFASGDVVSGAKTVVEAVGVSRRVADAIDEYIKSTGG